MAVFHGEVAMKGKVGGGRAVLATLLCIVLPRVVEAQAISTQALSKVPVSLQLSKSIWQVAAESSAELEVSLRNAMGQPVAISTDTNVQVRSSMFAAPLLVVIPANKSSASFSFKVPSSGSGKIEAFATRLSSAHCVLLVGPSHTSPAPEPPVVHPPKSPRPEP